MSIYRQSISDIDISNRAKWEWGQSIHFSAIFYCQGWIFMKMLQKLVRWEYRECPCPIRIQWTLNIWVVVVVVKLSESKFRPLPRCQEATWVWKLGWLLWLACRVELEVVLVEVVGIQEPTCLAQPGSQPCPPPSAQLRRQQLLVWTVCTSSWVRYHLGDYESCCSL